MRHALYIDLGPKIGSSFSQGEKSNRENKAFILSREFLAPRRKTNGTDEGENNNFISTRALEYLDKIFRLFLWSPSFSHVFLKLKPKV